MQTKLPATVCAKKQTKIERIFNVIWFSKRITRKPDTWTKKKKCERSREREYKTTATTTTKRREKRQKKYVFRETTTAAAAPAAAVAANVQLFFPNYGQVHVYIISI